MRFPGSSTSGRRLAAAAQTAAIALALGLLPAAAPAADEQDLIDKLPLWQPGRSITTSIKDALPTVNLVGPDEDHCQDIPDNWMIPPGYYRAVIRSYCLHAGAYGPTKGDGYLIAPLKGDRAPLIRKVLVRSVSHPEIEQSDVQRLIWGIEDGAKWDNYDAGFKQRIAPLVGGPEIALLNIEPQRAAAADEIKKRLGGLVPGAVRNAVDQYAELRNSITRLTSFDELERIAVKTGVAPWGKDSRRDVQPGSWAYIGNGFYLRAFVESYPTTTLEVFRAVRGNWTFDDKRRVTRFAMGGYVIDTTYADAPATQTVNGASAKVWRFKTVTYRHPDGRTATIEDTGYVVADGPAPERDVPGGGVEIVRDDSLGSMQHYKDGLKTASNPTDLKSKLKWIVDHQNRVDAAFGAASNALAGDEGGDPGPSKLDPSSHTATPANTSKQREALSAFKKK